MNLYTARTKRGSRELSVLPRPDPAESGARTCRRRWRRAHLTLEGHSKTGSVVLSMPGSHPMTRAGAAAGRSTGSPKCRRIFSITAGSSMDASSRKRPPQSGQARTSIARGGRNYSDNGRRNHEEHDGHEEIHRTKRCKPSFSSGTLKLISRPIGILASFMYVNSCAWCTRLTLSTAFSSTISWSSTRTSTR